MTFASSFEHRNGSIYLKNPAISNKKGDFTTMARFEEGQKNFKQFATYIQTENKVPFCIQLSNHSIALKKANFDIKTNAIENALNVVFNLQQVLNQIVGIKHDEKTIDEMSPTDVIHKLRKGHAEKEKEERTEPIVVTGNPDVDAFTTLSIKDLIS